MSHLPPWTRTALPHGDVRDEQAVKGTRYIIRATGEGTHGPHHHAVRELVRA
jgi:hypothetical protein